VSFQSYDNKIILITHTQYYASDAFGLQTLDKAGKIHVHVVAGVEHVDWHGNKDVFNNCIEPYLD
jgi:hypothetical protein